MTSKGVKQTELMEYDPVVRRKSIILNVASLSGLLLFLLHMELNFEQKVISDATAG